MSNGTVKWFNSQKGYGFISHSEKEDLFVHHSDIKEGYLQEGDQVAFEIGEGKKGPCAINVSLA